MSAAATGPVGSGSDLLAGAADLRWARPDLVAAVAEHVAETGSADDRAWVAAAGWLVYGRSAVGDGRECASAALGELGRRPAGLWDDPAAARLRVEVALLAANAGESERARDLATAVLAGPAPADIRADAFGVLARCTAEERPGSVDEPARRAEVAWAEVGGPHAEIGAASVALVATAALRRAGRADAAVDRAAEGLARLDLVREADAAPSRHIAAALAAEWIGSLLDAGRPHDAREGCGPLESWLRDRSRPSRQAALLRLTVARAEAGHGESSVAEALQQAAADAAAADAPDLESVCLSTLGALHEKTGRLDAALDAVRRGVEAHRRDAARRDRFLAALQALPAPRAVTPPVEPWSAPWDAEPSDSPIGDLVARTLGASRPSAAVPPRAPAMPSLPPAPPPSLGRPGAGTGPAVTGGARSGPRDVSPAGPEVRPADRYRDVPPARAGRHGNAARPSGTPGPSGDDPLFGAFWPDPDAPVPTVDVARPAFPAADLPGGSAARSPTRRPQEPGGGDPGRPAPPASVPPAAGDGAERPAAVNGSTPPDAAPHPLAGSPWSTGRWSSVRPARGTPPRDGGRRRRRDAEALPPHAPTSDALDVTPPVPPPPVAPEPLSTEGDGWLQAALAELDRVWGTPAPAPASERPAARRADEVAGCVVVVDVVRAGEPVPTSTTPEAAIVLQSVAGYLDGALPAGARLRRDADALAVVMPSLDRGEAGEWMHRVLPPVFSACVADDGRLSIRAAVHDIDGPVGAQLVHRLGSTTGRRAAGRHGVPAAAGPPPSGGGRRRRADPGDGPAEVVGSGPGRHGTESSGSAPADGPPAGAVLAPGAAAGVDAFTTVNGDARPGSDDTRPPVGGSPAPATHAPATHAGTHAAGTPAWIAGNTEGLGIADLLAGALAAYRSI